MTGALFHVDNSTGDININGITNISGATTISGETNINGTATISGAANINGATNINGVTNITGATTINGATTITGAMTSNTPFVMVGRNAGRVYEPNIIVCNVTGYNRGNCYNTSNGRFTCPSGFAGYYLFIYNGLGGDRETYPNTRWWRNGSLFDWGAAHVNNSCSSRHGLMGSCIVYLSVGDYFEIRARSASLYGSSQIHSTLIGLYIST